MSSLQRDNFASQAYAAVPGLALLMEVAGAAAIVEVCMQKVRKLKLWL